MARAFRSKYPRVPYDAIARFVGSRHVGERPEYVACVVIRRLVSRSKSLLPTDAELREAGRYAAAVHEENRDLYRRVQSGRI